MKTLEDLRIFIEEIPDALIDMRFFRDTTYDGVYNSHECKTIGCIIRN